MPALVSLPWYCQRMRSPRYHRRARGLCGLALESAPSRGPRGRSPRVAANGPRQMTMPAAAMGRSRRRRLRHLASNLPDDEWALVKPLLSTRAHQSGDAASRWVARRGPHRPRCWSRKRGAGAGTRDRFRAIASPPHDGQRNRPRCLEVGELRSHRAVGSSSVVWLQVMPSEAQGFVSSLCCGRRVPVTPRPHSAGEPFSTALFAAAYSGVPNLCHSEPAGEESRGPRTDAVCGRDSSFLWRPGTWVTDVRRHG